MALVRGSPRTRANQKKWGIFKCPKWGILLRHQQPFNEFSVVAYDIETIVEDEPADGSFPPWPRHRPVAASFLSAVWGDAGYDFMLDTIMCEPGSEAEFYGKVDRLLPRGATAVTYHGRGFDARCLSMAMAHRTDLPNLAHHVFAGRYAAAHCDLADEFGGMGAARPVKLADICAALGIPAKIDVNGGDVGALWKRGEYKKIRDYVAQDVIGTYLCWLHYIAFSRSNERLLHLPLAQLAAWIESTPGLAHLKPFADCRPARVARVRAPALRAGAALADAARRLQREQDEAAFAAGRASSF